ncbi:homeobox-leucine zipper protein HAT14-like [Diospyros lotus]|uniref:homeobox-leucine zipper protein HAT14-like n=1 Tax=Diospyros lotus TaxID=55363 RepID=UPI002259CDF0|nr:homeobox-leucine zipper protein HAT14-like [Diospyros lotus]
MVSMFLYYSFITPYLTPFSGPYLSIKHPIPISLLSLSLSLSEPESVVRSNMELALSLGETPKAFTFLDQSTQKKTTALNKDPGFCMALGPLVNGGAKREEIIRTQPKETRGRGSPTSDQPVQLDLLPLAPVPRRQPPPQLSLSFPWLTENVLSHEPGRGLDGNRLAEDGAALSSPNSTVSSFQMDLIYRSGHGRGKRDAETYLNEADADQRGASSRGSDEEENGLTRKKLRLSKEQSAFLEESFKEHSTLNPKQKLALAKQLNLRPRQVEVWFQNRRARTKLKQTEVDCEYLKRCYETLTEENRRLQKEVQELRALKTSQPFYMQLPATTLTMCPSCERVVTTTATTTATGGTNSTLLTLTKSRSLFPHAQHQQQAASS